MVGLEWDAFEEWLLAEGRHDDRLDDLQEALRNRHAEAALPSSVCIMSTLQDICPEWREFVIGLKPTTSFVFRNRGLSEKTTPAHYDFNFP